MIALIRKIFSRKGQPEVGEFIQITKLCKKRFEASEQDIVGQKGMVVAADKYGVYLVLEGGQYVALRSNHTKHYKFKKVKQL